MTPNTTSTTVRWLRRAAPGAALVALACAGLHPSPGQGQDNSEPAAGERAPAVDSQPGAATATSQPEPTAPEASEPATPIGIPRPLDESAFEALLTNPPFTRALNLSDSLVLTGVARIDDQPVVTVMDRNTRETFVVSTEQPNIQGWRMVDLVENADPAATQVQLSVNGETITIRYGAEQLDPVASREGRSRPGAARGDGGGRERGDRSGGGDRSRGGWGNSEAMQRMQNMSDEQRQQMRDYFNSNRERLRGASPEERQRMVDQAMERVERGSRGGGRRR